MCNVLWDARDDWSGCPLGRERIENRKPRAMNCFRRNLISGMRLRVMCAPFIAQCYAHA
jgi:hypothetical protein